MLRAKEETSSECIKTKSEGVTSDGREEGRSATGR